MVSQETTDQETDHTCYLFLPCEFYLAFGLMKSLQNIFVKNWTLHHIPVFILCLYPMTSVKIIGGMGCWELHDFSTPSDLNPPGSWDKSKNTYPLRNHKVPNSATVVAPETTRPAVLWLDDDGCLIGNDAISHRSWVFAIMILTMSVGCWSGLTDMNM